MKLVEATFLMPLTILITVSLITLTMHFYSDLEIQIEEHEARIVEELRIQ